MLKPKQNCQDLFDWVQYVMKTRQDNDVIDYTGLVYTKKETELLWPIGLGAICDENQIRQRRDWSY